MALNKDTIAGAIVIFVGVILFFSLDSSDDKQKQIAATTQTPTTAPIDNTLSATEQDKFKSALSVELGNNAVQVEKLEGIEMELTKNDYYIKLWLKKSPQSITEVEHLTKGFVKSALNVLAGEGKNPMKDWTAITVRAYQHVKGETGGNLTASYGKATYNFNTDQIDFEAAKK